MTRPPNDTSTIVGVSRMATMLGRSRDWARARFREWLEEQEMGGPIRVIVGENKTIRGKKHRLLFTTLSVIQREFVGAIRDPVIMRKLKDLDAAVDFLTKRCDNLSDEVRLLKKRAS